ncbi:MAG: hypothetical protein K0S65_2456 [Labilithrix sp.]|nr:hypothetical protein [Labilithrix sp.]
MKRSVIDRAVRIVDRLGIALVYPIDNKPEPRSLWSELHPKVTMEWSWDEGADPRVAELWHLREQLARSHDVAYAKWFRGRATFFSLPVFHAILGRLAKAGDVLGGLPREALDILELLRERSPLSTKELRAQADLRGKEHEAVFNHAMEALWSRLLVVGTGEVPDGAFPSLAVGATELLFEDTWSARRQIPRAANEQLDRALADTPAYDRELRRALEEVATGKVAPARAKVAAAARLELAPKAKRPSRRRSIETDDPPFTEPTAAEVFTEDR